MLIKISTSYELMKHKRSEFIEIQYKHTHTMNSVVTMGGATINPQKDARKSLNNQNASVYIVSKLLIYICNAYIFLSLS